MAKESNWDKLRKRDIQRDPKFRNVYDSQQMDWKPLDEKIGIGGYLVGAILIAVLAGALSWLLTTVWKAFRVASAAEGVLYGFLHTGAYWKAWPGLGGCLFILVVSSCTFIGFYQWFMLIRDAQNVDKETADINQYENDQHIQLPEEMMCSYDFFPDVGYHSSVLPSTLLSHVAILNKGLKPVYVSRRAQSDIVDEDGNICYYAGEALVDEDGVVLLEKKPCIDEKFMDALFDASGLPNYPELRRKFDATVVPYNPDGKNRDKLKGYDRLSDLINSDWELPEYEPQRAAGVYVVDTASVNTMCLAITRAGKGQTIIEPTIDMWTREKRLNNMVINDPKGELLVKFYAVATIRGLEVVQFNLINAMKTNVYNPLGMAAEAAREGNFTKTAAYVENIAEVFFPVDGGEDPVWPNAANNAFKRSCYGLIDYYLEKEKQMRRNVPANSEEAALLEAKLDEMWGHVTLFNCYQFFTSLTSKKLPDPTTQWMRERNEVSPDMTNQARMTQLYAQLTDKEAPGYNPQDPELNREYREMSKHKTMLDTKLKGPVWDGQTEKDAMSVFFGATQQLPKNTMRGLVKNADDSLKSMGGADKMIASWETLYGECEVKPCRRVVFSRRTESLRDRMIA